MQMIKLLFVSSKNIGKNRMRSLLTILGIVIGVAAVIIMVAIGKGAQNTIESRIRSFGTNLISIYPGSSSMGGVSRGAASLNRMTIDDVEEIEEASTLLAAISPVAQANGQVIGGGNNWYTSIQGVSPEYLEIRDWELASGTLFTDHDVTSRRKVAIIGHTVLENLYGENSNPVGERIQVRNIPFTIIGVLEQKGTSSAGPDQDDVILTPVTTVLYRLNGEPYIRSIVASAISEEAMDAAQEQISAALRQSHRLSGNEEDDFTIRNQTDLLDMASETTQTLTLLLGSIAGVSLLVGGIGIMNIMLVTVTERTREIGLCLAVGARGRDVLTQFLVEAVVLCLIGGCIGILLAVGVTWGINHWTSLNTVIDLPVVFMAFLFSGMVGVFFGYYPARRAASMNPIDALHYE